MMAAARGSECNVDCRRFQRWWMDQSMAIQVGGSSVGDELPESSPELVADGERFFLLKFSKILSFSEQSLALSSDTM